ncbi:Ferric/cupric reductase transmembrane component 2 [Escovopsis weberi]|uniref:Ferric/cupric reductase transmembrane component 2 n=1 Tax=Escovopsis weberi TaxID=150374 RepID=A0A0M8N4K5_ESCWE|nr:Ferric/cupric reductase transmembrane component 2 [Escovopsis weberi]
MATRLHYLLCLLFAACALASKPLGAQCCAASCYYSLLKAPFSADTKDDETVCTNPLKVESTYMCIRQHCTDEQIVPGIAWYSLNCKKSTKVVSLDLYHKATDNVTEEYLDSLPTIGAKDKTVWKEVALPSKALFDPVNDSVLTYYNQRVFNLNVRWSIYGYWALVLLLGTIHNLWSMVPSTRSDEQNKEIKPPRAGIMGWFNASILMAPTFGYHHHQPLGWFHVPLRLQTIVIFGYFAVHVGCCAPYYNTFPNNYYYKTNEGQVLRYFCDRLAHLMAAAMPFIFLFGGRANLLVYITGWSYRTFNVFHRWIAVILTIEGIIHAVGFSAYYGYEKGLDGYREELKTDPVFLYGLLMLVALGLMIFLSLGPFRQRMYEFFKIAHISLTAIFVAGYYYHVKDQFSGYYLVWAWACIGLWVGDYFMRFVRILVSNYKQFLGSGVPALVSYSDTTGMMRVQVHPSFMSHRQTPGTYYFLHFSGWRVWENHPFTLAGRSIDYDEFSSPSSPEQSDRETTDPRKATPPHVRVLTGGKKRDEYLTFLIKPREGTTARLRDSLRCEDGSYAPRRMNVVLEGPYGVPARLDHFDHVLFVAGGSGITTVLPYLRRFFEDRTSAHVPNVKLAWSVRHEGLARDVLANDLRLTECAPSASSKLELEFYVTNAADAEKKRHSRDPRFRLARPDVDLLVEDFVARNNSGRTAIFVCGPAEMADKTRLAVMRYVKRGYSHVELFEEMFTM